MSVTRPSASVAPRHPDEGSRKGNGDGDCAGLLGDAEIGTPLAGPSGDVTWKVARPPTMSGISTVPLSGRGTTREVASTTPAHRSVAVVDTRYRPAASRSNVARPC